MQIKIIKTLREFAHNVSARMGIALTIVEIIEGNKVGCIDSHLMKITINDYQGSDLVYQSDIELLLADKTSSRLEIAPTIKQ